MSKPSKLGHLDINFKHELYLLKKLTYRPTYAINKDEAQAKTGEILDKEKRKNSNMRMRKLRRKSFNILRFELNKYFEEERGQNGRQTG